MGGRGATRRRTGKQVCDICSWKFPTKKLLADHHTRHHSIRRCPNCFKTFMQTKKFIRHLRSHIDDQPYECKICLSNFSRKRHLVIHRKHCVNPKHACDQCPMKFVNPPALMLHKMTHEEGPYKCSTCYAKFTTARDRVRHMLNHLHTCALCMVNFPTSKAFLTHILKVHRGRLVPKPPGAYVDDRSDSVVDIDSDSDEGSDSMEDSPSSSGEDTDSDKETEHQAQDMDTAVEPVHELKHKNKFICFICLLLFPTSECLQVHMKDHKWFPCSKCSKFFSNGASLKSHEGSCSVTADLSYVHSMVQKAMESLPESVKVPGVKHAIERQMTNLLIKNPNCEIRIKNTDVVHREKEIQSVAVINQSSCPSLSIDPLSPQERLLLLDKCHCPSLNFLDEVHMVWLTNFVKKTKSLDFPLNCSLARKVFFVESLVSNALFHISDVPLSEKSVSHLSDMWTELDKIARWHMRYSPDPKS